MNHLHVVTSTLVTDPLTAGLSITFGGDALKNVLDVWPRLLVSTRHDGRTITGTLLTTRHTSTNETDTLLGKVLATTVGVWVVGVSTIDDDVTLLDASAQKSLDEVVNGFAGLDKQHHTTGLLELGDKLLGAVSADDGLALGFILEEAVHL